MSPVPLTLREARDLLASRVVKALAVKGPHPKVLDTLSLEDAQAVLAAVDALRVQVQQLPRHRAHTCAGSYDVVKLRDVLALLAPTTIRVNHVPRACSRREIATRVHASSVSLARGSGS